MAVRCPAISASAFAPHLTWVLFWPSGLWSHVRQTFYPSRFPADETSRALPNANMATVIRVPCSSANIGPGFDVIGLALNLYLEVQLTVTTQESSTHSLNCRITYEGVNAASVPLVAEDNLITRTAVYVLRCHGIRAFPAETHVHVKNPIPLGRGLGSSAAAIVAGVNLANEVGSLQLSKARMLDYCLMEERHPDNVAAALYGGFVGTYLNELSAEDTERLEIPLSEVLPEPAGGIDTGTSRRTWCYDMLGRLKTEPGGLRRLMLMYGRPPPSGASTGHRSLYQVQVVTSDQVHLRHTSI